MLGSLLGGVLGGKGALIIGAATLLMITSAGAYHFWTVSGLEKDKHILTLRAVDAETALTAMTTDRDKLRVVVEDQNQLVANFAAAGAQSSATADANASEALRVSSEQRLADSADPTTGPERMTRFFEVTP